MSVGKGGKGAMEKDLIVDAICRIESAGLDSGAPSDWMTRMLRSIMRALWADLRC